MVSQCQAHNLIVYCHQLINKSFKSELSINKVMKAAWPLAAKLQAVEAVEAVKLLAARILFTFQ